jgi:hypothetical protein
LKHGATKQLSKTTEKTMGKILFKDSPSWLSHLFQ